jgi:hypothetical protein
MPLAVIPSSTWLGDSIISYGSYFSPSSIFIGFFNHRFKNLYFCIITGCSGLMEPDTLIRDNNCQLLRSIRRLQKQTGFATLAFQEPEAMHSIRKFSESTKLASLALSQSKFMKSTQLLAESSKLGSLAFRESEAMKL